MVLPRYILSRQKKVMLLYARLTLFNGAAKVVLTNEIFLIKVHVICSIVAFNGPAKVASTIDYLVKILF